MTARELGQRGIVALERRDYQSAEESFSRADALVHAPTLLLGLARSQVGLGKLVEAHETYARIVREGVEPSSPPSWVRAVELARTEAAALAPRLSWLLIRVDKSRGIRVEIDGNELNQAAIGVRTAANSGAHHLVAYAQGRRVIDERTVSLAEGETREVRIQLAGAQSNANASSSGDAGDSSRSPTPTNAASTWQRPVGWTSLAVAGAGLLVGGVFGGLAISRHGELRDACPAGACPADRQGTLDEYRAFGTVSTVAFVVSGSLAVAGTVLLTTAPSERPGRTGVWIAPLGFGTTVEF